MIAFPERVDGLDINASDRVYRMPSGRLFKVRVLRLGPPPRLDGRNFGLAAFELSAALCGADGKALAHGDGYAIAPSHRLTLQADATPSDWAAQVDLARYRTLADAERAAILEEEADKIAASL